MSMAINERYIRLKPARSKSDRILTDKDYQMDEEVNILIRGQIVEIKEISNNDGSVDKEFIVKGEIEI